MRRRAAGARSREERGGGYHVPSDDARRAERDALAVADDLAPLLDALGIQFRRGDAGRKLTARCPSPDHQDRGPSWFVNNDVGDSRFGTHACQSCGFRGGPAHLAARAEGGTGEWDEAATLLRSLFLAGYDLDATLDRTVTRRTRRYGFDVVRYDLDELGIVPAVGTPAEDYLLARGVPAFVQALVGASWAPRGVEIPREDDEPLRIGRRVILPVTSGGDVVQFAARSLGRAEPKYIYAPSPTSAVVWGLDLWPVRGNRVAVVEGILDAIAIRLVTGMPAFSVLRSRMTDVQAAKLRTAASIVVVPDADDAGDKLVGDVRTKLPSVADVSVARLPRRTDAGDALSGRLDPDVLRRAMTETHSARSLGSSDVIVRYRFRA